MGGRNRKKQRRNSPDWSRFKGKDEAEMLNEFREKAKGVAVCAPGRNYGKRPLTMEEELWRKDPDSHISMLGEEERRAGAISSSGSRGRLGDGSSLEESEFQRSERRREQEEHQKRM